MQIGEKRGHPQLAQHNDVVCVYLCETKAHYRVTIDKLTFVCWVERWINEWMHESPHVTKTQPGINGNLIAITI